MVLHKHGERLYNGLISTLSEHLQEIARLVEEKEGVSFLAELKKHWDDHNKSTQMIRDILMVRVFGIVRARVAAHMMCACDDWCLKEVSCCIMQQASDAVSHNTDVSTHSHLSHPQYMDRTFVAQQQRTPVFALGLELWRNHVVRSKHIAPRLRVSLAPWSVCALLCVAQRQDVLLLRLPMLTVLLG